MTGLDAPAGLADGADLAAVRAWCADALVSLDRRDAPLVRLAHAELRRQRGTLNLVAAASPTLPAALVAHALLFSSVTAEGYAGGRYHPGTEVVDQVEQLARGRAERLFGAPHANVQPLSGSAANLAVLYGLLDPGDTVLALELDHGGHLTHVSRGASIAKRVTASYYEVDERGLIDYAALAVLVKQVRPRLLICGGSAYPRQLDFAAFRAAADEVDALLMADVSHVSGLVAAGAHPSPVPHCDVITTSTYKQLCGPRGGLLLRGASSRLSARALDRAVFPGFQGTPDFGGIAAKAVALGFAARPEFAAAMRRVVRYARAFAGALAEHGVPVVSGGTDSHLVLADLRAVAVTGRQVADVLRRLGVLVNMNLVPRDPRPAAETSGIRIGTNDLGFRRVGDAEVAELARATAAVVAEVAGGGRPDAVVRGPRGRELAGCVAGITARGYREDWRQGGAVA
ncbi:serine hydroxymethyltransferase [Micromonospora sp. C28SCA-DRY-2]|uniref:serine hydroxymethyltransferase n=1 Tax=Micromonospora sp. C28SCA-DRY-2 TaxID=3059522 RepID=UPI0026771B5F|nr:serine hydroxymethyltransferase [Micromonospora sp. C28SCA-DRY-2]MDO3702958.1 serine hydroxymethyltransferase [Micromonospora sp. C28SCA-DRY-2]